MAFRWSLRGPTGQFEASILKPGALELEKAPLQRFLKHQHRVSALQTQWNQHPQPPVFVAARGQLEQGMIAASQPPCDQAAQGEVMGPGRSFLQQQGFELLMGERFQHLESLSGVPAGVMPALAVAWPRRSTWGRFGQTGMQRAEVTPAGLPAKVGVVGLGLIGGSLGLDLQALGCSVRGVTHRQVTADRALDRGLVETVSTDPQSLIGCELVILALPLERLLAPDPALVAALPPEAVVTDVGSVKGAVLQTWRALHPRFVASHPMAGTAEAGVEAGLRDLFRGRPWVATPDSETDPAALAMVEALATALGSDWFVAEAERHDQAVALISHVPVLVSAALLQAVGSERDPAVLALARQLASSGFADTTRVGGGNPQLGTAMAANNTAAVLRGLAAYRWSLEQLEEAILEGNWEQLESVLEQTKQFRPEFL